MQRNRAFQLTLAAVMTVILAWPLGLAAQVSTPKKPDNEPKKPDTGPKKPVTETKKTNKWTEKKHQFVFAERPFEQVFKWLAEKSGLPVLAKSPPKETFALTTPPNALFSLNDIVDLINESISPQKMILVRRKNSYALLTADVAVNLKDVTVVSSKEELAEHGETELVGMMIAANPLIAEDVQVPIKRMMGQFGQVSALPGTNHLNMLDEAKNLSRILDMIERLKAGEGVSATTFTHECKHVRAHRAQRLLLDLLGDPAGQLQQQQPDDRRGDSRDPRDRFRGPPGGGGSRPSARSPEDEKRIHRIAIDERRNSVYVTGPANIVARAKKIVETLDVPGDWEGDPVVRSYKVPVGHAKSIAESLKDAYSNSKSTRIYDVDTSTVVVDALPHDQLDIAKRINDPGSATKTEQLSVGAEDPDKVATTLNTIFGIDIAATTKSSLSIQSQTDAGAVLVHGTLEEIQKVKDTIKVITGSGTGGTPSNTRIITLDAGSAASLAEALRQILPRMRPNNPVDVIGPPQTPRPQLPDNNRPRPNNQRPPSDGMSRSLLNNGKLVPVAYYEDEPKEKQPQQKPKGAIKLSVIGNRLVIISDDPDALKLAQQMARIIIRAEGTKGDFTIIPLKHAKAVDAARVLDEAFNGRRTDSLQNGNPLEYFARFRQGNTTPPSDPKAERIRVVADPVSNSLLIKASPLDLMTIKRLLDKAIDSGKNESQAAMKLHYVGPLVYAKATDVAKVLHNVYAAHTKETAQPRTVQGIPGFGFVATEAASKQPSLWIGVDEKTNSLVLNCSKAIHEDVKKLVTEMEEGAKKSYSTVRVIPLKGIDPSVVQQAVDALQKKRSADEERNGARRTTPAPRREPPGGGLSLRPGTDARRPDFFEHGVKEDPKAKHLNDSRLRTALNQQKSSAGYRSLLKGGEESQQQPPSGTVVAPRSSVTVVPLPGTNAVIIRTNNPEDMKIIEDLIKLIQQRIQETQVVVELIELEWGDAITVTIRLNQLFSRVTFNPGGATGITPGGQTFPVGGQQAGQSEVAIIPLPRQNAILVATAKNQMQFVKDKIAEFFDVRNRDQRQARPFPLKRASAARVALLIQSFFLQRYSAAGDTVNMVQITYDDSSNTVFVQAGRAEMEDIERLIKYIDESVSPRVNDVIIYPLRNALADELSAILLQVINANVAPSTVPVSATGVGGGGLGGLGGGGGAAGLGGGGGLAGTGGLAGAGGLAGVGGGAQGLGGGGLRGGGVQGLGGGAGGLRGGVGGLQQGGVQGLGGGVAGLGGGGGTIVGGATVSSSVRFQPFDPQGRPLQPVLGGLLEGISITPDIRINALVISAPEKTMELVTKLIASLDVPPSARAEINVFPLKKADATTVATLLSQIFGVTTGILPPISILDEQAQGAPIIGLRITADLRTNSVIVVGSVVDLQVVDAVIAQLEDFDAPQRQFYVYQLKNSTAIDVQTAVTTFITQQLAADPLNSAITYQLFERQVVIVPEPIMNKLLISATPYWYERVLKLIEELDAESPQVVIQCLIAEVDLTNNEEFGVEFGIQSPLLFDRDVSGGTITSTGFNFNNPLLPLPNSSIISPSAIAFQGLNSIGVGRVSSTSGVGGFVFSAQSESISVLIRALKIQGRVDILSRPQIMTLDNQAARILIGQNFPISTGLSQNANNTLQGISYVPVGVQLQVIPKINPDGRVLMRVIPEVSSVGSLVNVGGTTNPAFNVQTIETTVSVMDGQTVVLGGLITTNEQKNESKVPLLGDLPFVGALFRFRTSQKMKQELVVILTPHIVRNRAEADIMMAQESRRMDWVVGDVLSVHGTTGLEPILPQPGPQSMLPPPPPPQPFGAPGADQIMPPPQNGGAKVDPHKPQPEQLPMPRTTGSAVPVHPGAAPLPNGQPVAHPAPDGANQAAPLPANPNEPAPFVPLPASFAGEAQPSPGMAAPSPPIQERKRWRFLFRDR